MHVHSKVLDSAQVLRALVELKLNRSHLISPSGAPLRVAYTHTQDPQTAQSSHSEDEEGSETPSPAGMLVVRPVVDGRDVLRATSSRGGKHHVIEKSTAVAMASGYCTRCMMKESEIQRLWKKIEGLEEQLCRALKSEPILFC